MTKLNYSFTDVELLNTALTHSSFVRGDNRIYPNNERMEFLGDAVLELCASEYLYLNYPKMNEGMMTRTRARTVCETALNIVAKEINDSKNNTTRFGSFSRARNVPSVSGKRENENFLLMFTVRNEAGSLAGALNIIGAHGFNMRSLRSRPMKDLQWNYYFYIEAEGNVNTVNGKEMMQELSAVCAKLRLVGSYYANNVK